MRKSPKNRERDLQAITLYDVLVDTLYPARARPGDRLVVDPKHERPVVVVRKVDGEWEPIREGRPEFDQFREMAAAGILHRRWPRF